MPGWRKTEAPGSRLGDGPGPGRAVPAPLVPVELSAKTPASAVGQLLAVMTESGQDGEEVEVRSGDGHAGAGLLAPVELLKRVIEALNCWPRVTLG